MRQSVSQALLNNIVVSPEDDFRVLIGSDWVDLI